MSKVKGVNQWMATVFILALTLVSSFASTQSARVRAVHVKAGRSTVQIAIEANKPLQYRVSQINDPIRAFIFELYPAVLWGSYQQTKPVGEEGIREVRVAQFSSHPEIVRVVVELDQDVRFSVTSLNNDKKLLISLAKQAPGAPAFSQKVADRQEETTNQAAEVNKAKSPSNLLGWEHIKIEKTIVGPPDAFNPAAHAGQASFLKPIRVDSSFREKLHELFVAKAAKMKPKKKIIKKYSPYRGGLVSFSWKNADLTDVVRSLADRMGLNVIVDTAVKGSVTLDLKNVPASQALSMVLAINGYSSRQIGTILVVGSQDKLEKLPTVPLTLGPQALQIIPLEHAKPADLKDTITSQYPEVKVEVERRTNSLLVRGPVSSIRKVKQLVSELDKPIVVPPAVQPKKEVIQLNYAQVKDVISQVKPLLPGDTVLIADERLNSLIVIGTEYAIGTVHSFVAAVDIPVPQVMLEMQVVSVSDTANRDLGIEWPAALLTNFAESAAGEGGTLPAPGGSVIGANSINENNLGFHTLVRDNIGFQAKLHFLIQDNKAKVLGAPRVATLNNKEANIQLGDRIPIVYFDPRAGLFQAQYIDVGVILKITPSISPDGSITVHVNPQVSQVTGFVQNFPQLSTRQADTTVRVKNGETIVLGGLLRETNTDAYAKIPLLGDIPILGEFFRHKTTLHDRTDLIITITPTLMANR